MSSRWVSSYGCYMWQFCDTKASTAIIAVALLSYIKWLLYKNNIKPLV
jgi:hypothetical protein